MKFCTVCGAELTEGKECTNCGTLANTPKAVAVQAPVCVGTPAAKDNSVGRAMSIVSLVCGIVSVISLSGISLGVIAMVFGIVAKKEGNQGGMATAGTVLGIVSLVMYVLFIVAYVLFFVAYIFLIILGLGLTGMESMAYYI